MDDTHRARRLRNEEVFREINERIADVAAPFAAMSDSELDIVCECSRRECSESIALPLAHYRDARSEPDTFVMLPAHAEPEIDEVVRREPGYVLARKRI